MTKLSGISLYELLVCLAILGGLAGVALPAFGTWRENAVYMEVAQAFFGALRESRQLAITTGVEHRVEFDLDARRFRLTHGNRPNESTESSWDQNVVRGWVSLAPGITIRSLADCSKSTGVENIHLNPSGSASSRYICIIDEAGQPRYRVGIPYSTTGKSVVRRWDSGQGNWK